MKSKRISDMTPDECLVELTMREFGRILSTAKKKAEAAQLAEDAVFRVLEDMCIDLDAPTEAENADNLADAITCYLAYGEYSHAGIMAEVRRNYIERKDS